MEQSFEDKSLWCKSPALLQYKMNLYKFQKLIKF